VRANEYHNGHWLFVFGAVTASAVWFTALGFGARRPRGFFTTPAA
jgi:L-lysine exporter family protein LysE/ArgO